MLWRATLSSFLLIGVIVTGLCAYFYRGLENCAQFSENRSSKNKQPFEKKAMSQHRVKVVKDLFLAKGEERLHHRIQSDHSILKLNLEEGHFELTEELFGVKGTLQEKVLQLHGQWWQQLRFLKADTATYDYRSHTFFSHVIEVALAKLPGKELPLIAPDREKIYAEAIAREATFFLTATTPKLQAKTLRAKTRKERIPNL